MNKYFGNPFELATFQKEFVLTGERRELKEGDFFLGGDNLVHKASKDWPVIYAIVQEAK